MDLTSYGIDGEKVAFDKDQSASGENILTTKSVLNVFGNLEGFQLKLCLHIFTESCGSHRPYTTSTFKDLASRIRTSDCVLRRYAKKLHANGYIIYSKLNKSDCKLDDEYIFSMGPKFPEQWIWASKLYHKKLSDHPRHIITPNDAKGSQQDPQRVHDGPSVDSPSSESQTVRNGLSEESKQSATDCQTVRNGLSANLQTTDNQKEIPTETPPVFFLSSKNENISLSSAKVEESFTQVKKAVGIGSRKKADWIKGADPSEERAKLKLQHQWAIETNSGSDGCTFDQWQLKRG